MSGHLQPASGSTKTFLWLWMGGWSDKWHTQVLQHDYCMMRVWGREWAEKMCQKNTPKITKNVTHLVRRRPTHVRLTSRRMMVRSIFLKRLEYVPLDHFPIGWWHQEGEIRSVVDTSRQNKKIIFCDFHHFLLFLLV